MMKIFIPFSSLILVTLLFGCSPNYVFDETVELNNAKWAYQDTLDFKVNITDTMRIYNLYMDVEHAVDYPRQNIYIQIHTLFPSGKRIKERVSIDFSDKSGQWYGDCGNDWCQLRVDIQKGAFFNAQGMHTFTIEQYMRLDPLPGIKSVSLKIEETDKSR